MREELRKNSIPSIHRGEDFHISSKPEILKPKILLLMKLVELMNWERSYQTSPENLNNPENFGEGSY